jgi:hypothetical protein
MRLLRTIGFLHTAAVHEPTFAGLTRQENPELTDVHVVDEQLLADALAGGITVELGERVRRQLIELRDQDASVIVCTCSTLGGLAETRGDDLGPSVLRVDRPMAERAARIGGRIGVVYAVQATAGPTMRLLNECVAALGTRATQIVPAPCIEAWPSFERGDLEGYLARVAARARGLARSVDVVVLAQASMAPVAEMLGDVRVAILCSPATAVQQAAVLAAV